MGNGKFFIILSFVRTKRCIWRRSPGYHFHLQLSLNPNLFHKLRTTSEDDQSCDKISHERQTNKDEHRDYEALKNHIKSEPYLDSEDAVHKSPHAVEDLEDEDDVFRNSATPPSAYANRSSALSHALHADNSEHSLMKMQMRKSFFRFKLFVLLLHFPQQKILKTL